MSFGTIPWATTWIVRKRFDSSLPHYTRFLITWQHFLRRCSVFVTSSHIPGDKEKKGVKPYIGFTPQGLDLQVNSQPPSQDKLSPTIPKSYTARQAIGTARTIQRHRPQYLNAWYIAVLSWRA
jgi:hypothetical protein